ncbi:hypothetical protein OHB49_40445 [Streptomyces sp. NBC_01717]|uniref:hypothetical protein n=1 Tax=Streptomyces sp. NBC_01717 TaxID=2975918 RepID=UPI002E336694|nr:hypothetical protein [Streptomyces sp. NBC_01717]
MRRGADLAVVAYARCGEGLVEAVHLLAAEMHLRGDPAGEQVRTPGSVGAGGAQGQAGAPAPAHGADLPAVGLPEVNRGWGPVGGAAADS